MDKQEFYSLLDKYLKGLATPEEEQRLAALYETFQQDDSYDLSADAERELEDRMLAGIRSKINQREKRLWRFSLAKRIAAAAAVVIALSVSLYIYKENSCQTALLAMVPLKKQDALPGSDKAILTLADGSKISLDEAEKGLLANQGDIRINKTAEGQIRYVPVNAKSSVGESEPAINTIYTPRGGKYQVVLPDGSHVWLNAESSLSYPTRFGTNERRVKLTGEAYFEIMPDKSVPFRVESNNQVVEVLGTHFNINSYEDEAFVKTTLVEGSVRVMRTESNAARLLKPGEQSLIGPSRSGIRVESADTEKETAWKNGHFQFRDTGIREVMREVGRWYDVQVEYKGTIPDEQFTGFISRNVKLSVVLDILEESGNVKCRVKNKKIIVTSSEN